MAGKKGRSGRKSIRSILRRFEDTIDEGILDIAKVQLEKALAGSTESARLLFEYRLPKQKVELDITLPNTGAIALLYRNVLLEAKEDYLLSQGSVDTEVKEVVE